MNDAVTQRGLEVFTEIMGEAAAAQMQAGIEGDGFTAAISKLATDFAFGSVWARDGLERKQRSLVTIGVLIAQKQTAELKNHVRIALRNGLTAQEIGEAVVQTLPYVGFPAVASATTSVIEVLREEGVDTNTRTSEERGLL